MHLLPVLPLQADETTVSWCARIARFHANQSCADWLKMMQLSRVHVMNTTSFCVERLSALTGLPKERIIDSNVHPVSERVVNYRNESFGAGFTTRTYTTYCPACLLEDSANAKIGNRVGRLSWLFARVRVCPHHNIGLVRRKNRGYYERFQDMNLVAPSDRELNRQISELRSQNMSRLQAYVTDRFAGIQGFEWLDSQRIDQAARACEMLGICRLQGAHADIDAVSHTQWNEAGALGLQAACMGPNGINEILEEIVKGAARHKQIVGPQSALGRIYQWLQFNKSKQDPGPIKQVVRDFVLDNIPVEAGCDLFGEVLVRRKRHSITSLSNEAGIHRKTLRRALVGAGIIQDDANTKSQIPTTFDAKDGDQLAGRINHSLPVKKLPAYLNCNRTQAQMMVKKGILRPIAKETPVANGILSNIAIDDLDDFLSTFRGFGRPVREASAVMVDVIAASEVVRVPVADIVGMVLDGRLDKVKTTSEHLRFRSVFVDVEDLRAAHEAAQAEHGLSMRDASKRLRLPTTALPYLRASEDAHGRPLLTAEKTTNARGTTRYRYPIEDIDRFLNKHVSLQELSDHNETGTRRMSRLLIERGIEPIMDRKLLGAKIFRRIDVQ
jgi:hypothetical protein